MSLEADGMITIYDIETGAVIAQYEGLEVHEAMLAMKAAQHPVAADGAVAPIKCAECGDEILPICEACAGDMRRS